jgi:hypothetical protein
MWRDKKFIRESGMSALTQRNEPLQLLTTRDPLIDCEALLNNRRGRDLSFFYALSCRVLARSAKSSDLVIVRSKTRHLFSARSLLGCVN